MDLTNFWFSSGATGGGGDISIGNSLRFRGAQYLTGNFSSSTWTMSFWVKRGRIKGSDDIQYVFSSGSAGLSFNNDRLNWFDGSNSNYTTQLFRDPSAWYHIVLSQTGTGANNLSIFVNGVQQRTALGVALSATSNNFDIGRYNLGNSYFFDGYMADVDAIDGQALQPTDFGAYNNEGVWVPVDYEGTYGTDGFHLTFEDPADIGEDSSGNNNDFTATGFELTDDDDPDYDSMEDSPTQNFATLNPLFNNGTTGPGTLSDGNLGYTAYSTPGYKVCPGTQSLKGGAYYWEYTAGNVNNSYPGQVGIIRGTSPATSTKIGWDTNNNVFGFSLQYNGKVTGDSSGEGTSTDQTIIFLTAGYVQGDIIGMYCDIPNNYLAWYKNGALFYEITNINSEYDWMPALNQYYNFAFNDINFGQQPFRYAIPSGYEPLQTQNMSAAPIADGSDQFRALTGTGADILAIAQGTNNNGTNWNPDVNTGFTNGLWWIKDMVNANQHQLVDSVRGGNLALQSPAATETAYAAPAGDSVAWCWIAGGTAVTNNDGTIETQVSANTDAGFSIATYTGNGGGTFGHGLNETPEFVITKSTTLNRAYECYHVSLGGTKAVFLNENIAAATGSQYWQDTDPTNQVVTVGDNAAESGEDYVAYCWHSVPGYSAFGSYTGNNNDFGPFIYTGFRPAFLLIKCSGYVSDWVMWDSTRNPSNPSNDTLFPNLTQAEYPNDNEIDFVSNGFKIRNPDLVSNNINTYIYAAFAENPFGGENVSPANAR